MTIGTDDSWLTDIVQSLGYSSSSDDSSTSDPMAGDISLAPHQHFDPTHAHGIVIGNPTEEMSYWHEQISPTDCANAIQQSAIEHLTHHSISQEQLSQEAQMHGWYTPDVGTPAKDFGKIITEHAHVPVESHYGGTLTEMTDKLNHGEEVFVGVNSTIEWLPDGHSALGQIAPDLFDPHHLAGQPADHIVQVTGVEIKPFDPQHSLVIVNDSGSSDGCGVEIPVDQFQQAMDASHGFIASTAIHQQQPTTEKLPSQNLDPDMVFGSVTHHHYHHLVPSSSNWNMGSGDSDSSSYDGGYDSSSSCDSSSDGGCDSDGDGGCD